MTNVSKQFVIFHVFDHDFEQYAVVVEVADEFDLGTEVVGLDFAELGRHLQAGLFEVELDERVDQGEEGFVDSTVLVDGEEVERTVELGGLLLAETGFEVRVLILVTGFVLLCGFADFGELSGGFVSVELLKVERVVVGDIDDFVDERSHVAQENEAEPVFLGFISWQVLFVFVDVKHEPAVVYLRYQNLSVSFISIFVVRFFEFFG